MLGPRNAAPMAFLISWSSSRVASTALKNPRLGGPPYVALGLK